MFARSPRDRPTTAHPSIGERIDVGVSAAAPHVLRPDRVARTWAGVCFVLVAGLALCELLAAAPYGALAARISTWLASAAALATAVTLIGVARATRVHGGTRRRAAAWWMLAGAFLCIAAAPVAIRGAVATEAASWIDALWPRTQADLMALTGRPWFVVLGPLTLALLIAFAAFTWKRAGEAGTRDTGFVAALCLAAALAAYVLPAVPGAEGELAAATGWELARVQAATALLSHTLLLVGSGASACVALRQLAAVADGQRYRVVRGLVDAQPYDAIERAVRAAHAPSERSASVATHRPQPTVRGNILRSIAKRTPTPEQQRPVRRSKPKPAPDSNDLRPDDLLPEDPEPEPLPPLRPTEERELTLPPLKA